MAVMLSKTYDESRFAKIETDLVVIKWMLGVLTAGMASLMGGVASLMIKAFGS